MSTDEHGGYASKHPMGFNQNPAIVRAIQEKVRKNGLPCAVAFDIASTLGVSPLEVGKNADLLEIPLIKCQLGLFGYQPNKKIVKPETNVSASLKNEISKGLVNNRLPCKTAWQISQTNNISKMSVSAACEALGIKIKPCQLGSF